MPTAKRASAPATCAAAMCKTCKLSNIHNMYHRKFCIPFVISAGLGDATMTCLTPAATAVTAVMSTDEGRGNLPPGA